MLLKKVFVFLTSLLKFEQNFKQNFQAVVFGLISFFFLHILLSFTSYAKKLFIFGFTIAALTDAEVGLVNSSSLGDIAKEAEKEAYSNSTVEILAPYLNQSLQLV